MGNVEVLDARKYKLVGAVPLVGKGRPLAVNEQEMISALVDPSRINAAQIALDNGVMTRGPITITVRFADGREAGVRLVPQ